MSGRRGRGGGAAPGGRGRLVVMGGGRGGGGAGRGGGGGGPPKTLNERFQALATAPQAKRKAQANQTQANARFNKVRQQCCTLREPPAAAAPRAQRQTVWRVGTPGARGRLRFV